MGFYLASLLLSWYNAHKWERGFMLDSFLKQCTPYRLCAAQSAVTLAAQYIEDGYKINTDFSAVLIFSASNLLVMCNSYVWINTDKRIGQKNIYKPTPFAVQAIYSGTSAAISAFLHQTAPCNTARIALSVIICGISTYNSIHTTER